MRTYAVCATRFTDFSEHYISRPELDQLTGSPADVLARLMPRVKKICPGPKLAIIPGSAGSSPFQRKCHASYRRLIRRQADPISTTLCAADLLHSCLNGPQHVLLTFPAVSLRFRIRGCHQVLRIRIRNPGRSMV